MVVEKRETETKTIETVSIKGGGLVILIVIIDLILLGIYLFKLIIGG